MLRSELTFEYPEHLVAREPSRPSRVMCVDRKTKKISEIAWLDFLKTFSANDVIVRNDTKVVKRRLFAKVGKSDAADFEILFVQPFSEDATLWQVMCPASRLKAGALVELPNGVTCNLTLRGRVQTMKLSRPLTDSDFETYGEAPLPPYIQKARGERHVRNTDASWYQTAWATRPGSSAAPTASLHFSKNDFEFLKSRGVNVLELTLHVGLGTYLPVLTENLLEHHMHFEDVEIKKEVWAEIQAAKRAGKKIWSIGTTVTRALESAARGKILLQSNGDFRGGTDLLILPGYEFQIVDGLMTNFHQPESTLLALVMAFANVTLVRDAYAWAIQNELRLFSYGDLSVWI